MIPFDQIRDTALAQGARLLADWFPAGRVVGREFKTGNLQGDPGESLSINLATGRWADFASGEKGPDLIGLRAAIRRTDRVEAARELGEMLCIAPNGRDRQGPGHAGTRASAGWHPMAPPPGTPRPDDMLRAFDTVYDYTDAEDHVTHYVGRIEARDGRRKQFVPISYGTLAGVAGWHRKAPAEPRPLYGLNRLAAFPDAPVLVCEGEKAADAARAMLPNYACISWFGGCAQVGLADLAPLRDRSVIIWPDADNAGRKAAACIATKLPEARVLDVGDLAEGADAADVMPADPEAWLEARLPPDAAPALWDFLSIEAWIARDIPPPDRLLGDLITTTSRTFLVGRTGLGKTHFAVALACGTASGTGFLDWRSSRPARVLIIDGEMPGELIQQRMRDAQRRLGAPLPPQHFAIFARDQEEEFARRFPALGKFEPLNKPEGQAFVRSLIDMLGGVDVVIFDNVMSLVAGDQKDEVPWSETLPLVASLTAKRIGQVWLDHTGHDGGRQYGSATKSWRMDSVGVMLPLSDDDRAPREMGFKLSFDAPGKARRRTPENWNEFAPRIIRLTEDRWTSEVEEAARSTRKGVPPQARLFHAALVDALAGGAGGSSGRVPRDAWLAECVRRNLIDPPFSKETSAARGSRLAIFRKMVSLLQAARWIGGEDGAFTDLTRRESGDA